ncbi:MAG: universal stress protein [Thermodesulfobacteriota bacterium]|nr:universal stress protein [Thermodesulfobacteriota bacterium]
MYERILVPLDGSSAAEIALPFAEEIAAKHGAEIILASVSELAAGETDHLYRSYLERIAEQVQRQFKDWGAKEEAKVKSVVLLGKPASEILRYADENNVSLITMASRGRSSRGPWLLGNIAAKVLRATGKPVLLIRAPADKAALQQRRLVSKILVPLDGSKLGEVAIPYAEALAQVLGAELILFQTFVAPISVGGYERYSVPPAAFKEREEQVRASAMDYLDSLGKAFQEKGMRTLSVVREGSPPDQILEYAETNGIDLIAMSTHGRSGIGRWVLGSVTDKVLHAGDTAILTVRATKM